MAARLMGLLEATTEAVHNAFFVDLFVRASNASAVAMYHKVRLGREKMLYSKALATEDRGCVSSVQLFLHTGKQSRPRVCCSDLLSCCKLATETSASGKTRLQARVKAVPSSKLILAVISQMQLGYSIYRRVLGYYSDAEDALDMRKAMPRDRDKRSVVPLKHPIRPHELEFD